MSAPTPYYERNGIVLYHGSCDDILPLLEPASVDLVFTSPPYNLGGASNPDLRRRAKERSHAAGGPRWSALGAGYGLAGDGMPEDEYRSWQVGVLSALQVVTTTGGSCFYNHKIRVRDGAALHPVLWLVQTPWTLRQEIIWDRGSTHQHDEGYFWPHDERLYWLTNGRPNLTGLRMGWPSIWQVTPPQHHEHPAPFPLPLPSRAINALAPRVVLDPFAGSGTTLLAAKMAGASAIGIELEERFCKMAAERLSQETLPLFGEVA